MPAANMKKKPGTDVFDPTAALDGDHDGAIDHEPALGRLLISTIPLAERRVAARQLLSAVCREDTVASLLTISGAVAIQEESAVRARIAIGGHFQTIYHAIQKDVTSDGDDSPNRQKLALQLTYEYIRVVHGYNRPVARNHILIYQCFAGNAEAQSLLTYTEMLLLADQVKDDEAIVRLIDEKRQANLTAVEFKALTRDFVLKTRQAQDEIKQMKEEVAQARGEIFLKATDLQRLQTTNGFLEKSLAESRESLQRNEEARADVSSRLVASRAEAQTAEDRVHELEAGVKNLEAQLEAARNSPTGPVVTRDVEVVPPEYASKLEALAAAEAALAAKQAEVQALETETVARQEELASTRETLADTSKMLATGNAFTELIDHFSQFHTSYITTRLKVAASGTPEPFRQILMEIDAKMQNLHLEVQAAIARGA